MAYKNRVRESNSSSNTHSEYDDSFSSEHIYSSIYDEVAVHKAFGPTMEDVGLWFVQEQRSRYMQVQNSNQESLRTRPPLPLPPPDMIGSDKHSRSSSTNEAHFSVEQPEIPGNNGLLLEQLRKLAHYGWYWGPLTRLEAEDKLNGQDDGTFLIRDSCNEWYLFSLSFSVQGKTSHMRLKYRNGYFSLHDHDPVLDSEENDTAFRSVPELIEKSMEISQKRPLFYGSVTMQPIRLLKPFSRRTKVQSLQHHCRFIIRQSIRFDKIRQLPLPRHMHSFLEVTSILI